MVGQRSSLRQITSCHNRSATWTSETESGCQAPLSGNDYRCHSRLVSRPKMRNSCRMAINVDPCRVCVTWGYRAVSHAGGVVLLRAAEQVELTRALSGPLAPRRKPQASHDPRLCSTWLWRWRIKKLSLLPVIPVHAPAHYGPPTHQRSLGPSHSVPEVSSQNLGETSPTRSEGTASIFF